MRESILHTHIYIYYILYILYILYLYMDSLSFWRVSLTQFESVIKTTNWSQDELQHVKDVQMKFHDGHDSGHDVSF